MTTTTKKDTPDVPAQPDLDTLLDDAEFPERTVRLCLKASLRQRWDAAQDELAHLDQQVEATRNGDGRIGASAGLVRDRRQQALAVQAIEAEMTANSLAIVIRGRSFADYNALLVKHPPREGNATDRMLGFNSETFHVANVRASIVSPDISDAQWDKLVARLTDRQFDDLASAALEVNRREDGSVPFSSIAYAVTHASAAT